MRAGPGGGSLGIISRYRRIIRARRSNNRWGEDVMWDRWLSHDAVANFWNNQATLANHGITIDSLEADFAGRMPLPLTKARDRTVRHCVQAANKSRLGLRAAVPWLPGWTVSATSLKGMGSPPLTTHWLTELGS